MRIPQCLAVTLIGLLGLITLALPLARAEVLGGGVAAIDIPESRAKLVTLEITDGHFSQYAMGKMRIELHDIDFRSGSLSSLKTSMTMGDFDNIWVDKMDISTEAFHFNTYELINNRRFELSQAITGNVYLGISENSLNHFLQHPKTLEKLEKSIQKKTGGIKLITIGNPSLKIVKGNQIQLNLTTFLGGQQMQIPMEILGELKLKDDNLVFSNLKVSSQDTALPLPVDVVKIIEKQLNDMINLEKLGKNNFVIHAKSLKMKKGLVEVTGNATFTRLEFGGSSK